MGPELSSFESSLAAKVPAAGQGKEIQRGQEKNGQEKNGQETTWTREQEGGD